MSPSDDTPSNGVTGTADAAPAASDAAPAAPNAAPRGSDVPGQHERAEAVDVVDAVFVEPKPAPLESEAVVAGEQHTATGRSTGQTRAHLTSSRRRIALKARSDHRPSQT